MNWSNWRAVITRCNKHSSGLLSLSRLKQRTDTADDVTDGERLNNVIIDAEFHPGDYVLVENLRGNEYDGRVSGQCFTSEPPAQLKSIHSRQEHVEKNY